MLAELAAEVRRGVAAVARHFLDRKRLRTVLLEIPDGGQDSRIILAGLFAPCGKVALTTPL
jgi:hypothetical protein